MTDVFEEFKRAHDLLSVVEQTTGQQLAARRVNKVRCPVPEHNDSNPSCAVYDDGGWKCFGCGASGTVIDWLGYGMVQGYDPDRDAARVIDLVADMGDQIKAAPRRKPAKPVQVAAFNDDLVSTWQQRLEGDIKHFRYWHEHGISAGTLRRFRAGFTGTRYAMPWFYRGVCTAIKTRRCDDDGTPKYMSIRGSRYAAPYNIDTVITADEPPELVLVVEDEKSVWAAHEHEVTAIAVPAGSWRTEYAMLLAGVRRVVIVPDRDEAGYRAAQTRKRTIRRAVIKEPPLFFDATGNEAVKDLHDWHVANLHAGQPGSIEDWIA